MRKTMKILVVFVSMCLCVSLFPAFTSLAALPGGGCGDGLKWQYNNGDLKIYSTGSGTGKMYDFPDITPWYGYAMDIKTVSFSGNVTYIGEDAFGGLVNVTSIAIPSGVTKIGDYAFESCTGLVSVSIPNTVTSIGKHAFEWCTSLKTVFIPSSVTSIGDYAFYACSSLTKVSGGSKIKTIGKYAFSYCPKLKSVSITSRVLKKIGACAFYKTGSLKTLYIKKTTKLTKSGVKKSLKGSSIKTVKVKKSKVKKYKKYFKKSNSGRKVKVRK